MARIRTLKPDFWTDEALSDCSPTARLLFIGTWSYADDYGNLERSSKQLKAQIFPYDGLKIEPLLEELIKAGVLIEYEADGKKYLHIKGFDKHQKVEKRSNPKHPAYNQSLITPRVVTDSSPTSSGSSSSLGKGREVSDREDAVPGLDLEAFSRWVSYRQQIRKPLKPVSMPAAQRELAAFGCNQAAVVEQSIAQGWQGLFDLRKPGSKPRIANPLDPTSGLEMQ